MKRHIIESRLPTIAALGIFCIAVAGCREGRQRTYLVRGSVSFADGALVRTGIVEFRSAESGLNARGKIDSSGQFQLGTFDVADGAVEGIHQVIVTQMVSRPDAIQPPSGHQHTSAPGLAVSPKHAHYATSGLTAEVLPKAVNEFKLVVKRRGEE